MATFSFPHNPLHTLKQGIYALGTSPKSDIQIQGTGVSGKHAILEINDKLVFIQDLNSTNCTRINNAVVRPKKYMQVLPGNVVTLGKAQIKLISIDGVDTGISPLDDQVKNGAPTVILKEVEDTVTAKIARDAPKKRAGRSATSSTEPGAIAEAAIDTNPKLPHSPEIVHSREPSPNLLMEETQPAPHALSSTDMIIDYGTPRAALDTSYGFVPTQDIPQTIVKSVLAQPTNQMLKNGTEFDVPVKAVPSVSPQIGASASGPVTAVPPTDTANAKLESATDPPPPKSTVPSKNTKTSNARGAKRKANGETNLVKTLEEQNSSTPPPEITETLVMNKKSKKVEKTAALMPEPEINAKTSKKQVLAVKTKKAAASNKKSEDPAIVPTVDSEIQHEQKKNKAENEVPEGELESKQEYKQNSTIEDTTPQVDIGQICVGITGVNTTKHTKSLESLGCRVSSDPTEITHLIADKPLKRTIKLIIAIAKGSWVVDASWIAACKKANSILEAESYLVNDKKAAEKWNFDLRSSIQKARSAKKSGNKLLNKVKITALPSAKAPSYQEIKQIVELSGGEFVANWSNGVKVIRTGGETAHDIDSCGASNEQLIESEWLLASVMRQEVATVSQHIFSSDKKK